MTAASAPHWNGCERPCRSPVREAYAVFAVMDRQLGRSVGHVEEPMRLKGLKNEQLLQIGRQWTDIPDESPIGETATQGGTEYVPKEVIMRLGTHRMRSLTRRDNGKTPHATRIPAATQQATAQGVMQHQQQQEQQAFHRWQQHP